MKQFLVIYDCDGVRLYDLVHADSHAQAATTILDINPDAWIDIIHVQYMGG